MQLRDTRYGLHWLMLGAIFAVAWWAYAPGLHGGFLFDDFGNLPALGTMGPIDNGPAFWRYITSSIADPTGRPLTLLSFLLDARDWPAAPYPFKCTNLILHLVNGALLFALLTSLGGLLELPKQQVRRAALFGSAMWLLHPLMVSTTLYIVQREAMLPATFVLAGMLSWLQGRHHFSKGTLSLGIAWSVTGLGACTVLAVLSKANGVLLPLYVLLLEFIIAKPRKPLAPGQSRQVHRHILIVLGIIPVIGIGAYLIWIGWKGLHAADATNLRPWTIAQRLMTEPRILLDYLQLLWLPRPFSSGLFNDQYVASTSWFAPVTTLPSLLAILALVVLAWCLKRRHAAVSLAVLFYFAGHLLESTSIPLELYFEHRNYIPALLMFWPLGLWLGESSSLRIIKIVLMVALPLSLAAMTHISATVWGDERMQGLIWAQLNPLSPRAQANAAEIDMQHGQPQEAARRLEKLFTAEPNEVQLAFNLLGAHCLMGGLQPDDMGRAANAMRNTRNPGALTTQWFGRMIPVALDGSCPGLTVEALTTLIQAGLQNPHLDLPGPRQDLTYLLGSIALAEAKPDAALAEFQHALDLDVRPGMASQTAATFGANGYPVQGLAMLDHYEAVQNQIKPPAPGMPMVHAWVLERQQYWPRELAHLRRQLTIDADTKGRENRPTSHDPDTHH